MHVEFWLEEPSAKVALDGLLPRLFAGGEHTFVTFQYGNRETLLAKLPELLRTTASKLRDWPELRVVVLLDRDSKNCRTEKAHLEMMAQRAGLATKAAPALDGRFYILNRYRSRRYYGRHVGSFSAPVGPRRLP